MKHTTMCARLLALAMALCLLLGMVPFAAICAKAISYPSVSVGENTLTLSEDVNYFSFTPEESGHYRITTSLGDAGSVSCQGSQGSGVDSYHYYANTVNQVFVLEGGTTYTLGIDTQGMTGEQTMTITKTTQPGTNGSFDVDEWETSVSGFAGGEFGRPYVFSDGAVDYITVESSNTEVVEVSADGNRCLYDYKGAGVATVTLTASSGTQVKINVTVYKSEDCGSLSVGTPQTVQMKPDTGYVFSYTAPDDGYYWFHWTGGLILNSEIKATIVSTDNKIGFVMQLTKDQTATMTVRPEEEAEFTIEMLPQTAATGISLNCGEQLEGSVGQTVPVTVTPEDGDLIMGLNAVSADPQIAEIESVSTSTFFVKFVAEGDTTITVSADGVQSQTLKVVATNAAAGAQTALENGVTKLALNADSDTYVNFTPSVDGIYQFSMRDMSGGNIMPPDTVENSYYLDENGTTSLVCALKEGTTYQFTIAATGSIEDFITVIRPQAAGSITVESWEKELRGYAGTSEGYRYPFPEGTADFITAVSSDEKVVTVTANGNTCQYRYVGAGTATVTLTTTGGAEETIDVKVYDIDSNVTLTAGNADAVTLKQNAGTHFTFTAPATGEYWIYRTDEEPIDLMLMAACEDFCADGKYGWVVEAESGQEIEIILRAEFGDFQTQVGVQAMTRATGIEFDGGSTLEGSAGKFATVTVKPVGGDYFAGLSAISEDGSIAEVNNCNTSSFELVFNAPGTTNIQVSTDDGLSATLTVTVTDYTAGAVKSWEGTHSGGTLQLNYNCTESGTYFLCNDLWMTFDIAQGSTQPLSGFSYVDGEYSGMVYKLEAGKSYSFELIDQGWRGDYAVYLLPVQLASSFTIPTKVNASAGQGYYLPFTYEGVMTFTVSSSDPEVALPGSGDPHGNFIHFVGEGTATITVTDQNGNKQTCKFTISGTVDTLRELDREIGIASNKSMTIIFTPEETGLYWIYSGNNAGFGVSVTKNGSAVAENYAYSSFESSGKVYQLSAGTEYQITYTTASAQFGYVNAELVSEASGLNIYTTQIQGVPGDVRTLWLQVVAQQGNAVANITAVSSDPSVAKILSVKGSGIEVELVGKGTATVEVFLNGQTVGTCAVTCNGAQEPAGSSGITLVPDNFVMTTFTGNGIQIDAPGDLSGYTVEISDEDVLMVDWTEAGQFGVIGLDAGTATVTVTLKDGSSGSVSIQVVEPERLAPETEYEHELQQFEGIPYLFIPDHTGWYHFQLTTDHPAQVGVRNPLIPLDERLEVDSGTDSFALELEAGTYYVLDVTNQEYDGTATMTMKVTETHAPVPVAANAATCTENGNIAYYICEICRCCFADAAAKNEVEEADVVIAAGHDLKAVAAVAPTCTQAGHSAYYICEICECWFSDADAKNEVEEDDVVIAAGHDLKAVAAVAPTCTQAGHSAYYICEICECWFSDADAKNEVEEDDVVIAPGHDLTYVPAVAPDYTKPGNVEYYLCSVCGVRFAEETAETVIVDVVLGQLIELEQTTADVSSEAIYKALDETETEGSVTIDLSAAADVVEVKLPVDALADLVEAKATLTVSTAQAVVTLDSKTLEAVVKAADAGEITLKVEQVETTKLNEKQQEAIDDVKESGVSVLGTITAELYSGDKYIGDDFNGGVAELRIPLELKAGEDSAQIAVFYVDDEGTMTQVQSRHENDYLYFYTSHFSEYLIVKSPALNGGGQGEVSKPETVTPNTGDSAEPVLWCTLTLVSLMGVVLVFAGKRRFRA